MTLLRSVRSATVAAAALLVGPDARAEARTLQADGMFQPRVWRQQWREDEEWFRREPPLPLPLPESLNGVIRPLREGEAGPERLERIRDVFTAMRACWRLPRSGRGPSGQQLTLRMSFKRNGEVLGKPRITYYQAGGDEDARERFRASVRAALERCTPLPLSDDLGSAVAGRPFTFRFVDDRSL